MGNEVISRRWMLIGLRVFAVIVLVAGMIYAQRSAEIHDAWAAGMYGTAVGTFFGRLLFWLVLAVYAWLHAGKYRAKR